MISREPLLHVGVLEGYPVVRGRLDGVFRDDQGRHVTGSFSCSVVNDELVLAIEGHQIAERTRSLNFTAQSEECTLRLDDVTIGVNFHWERKEQQQFRGGLRLLASPGHGITAINNVPLEEYLTSVISSEMSATAPPELLKAHAITSRSWLVAMLERSHRTPAASPPPSTGTDSGEIVRWYTREDHDLFDVCADDHCQRYQGITRILSSAAEEAVRATRGVFLVHQGGICDARYYKACGGRTENFENAWEDVPVPYLQSITDAPSDLHPVLTEEDMEKWILHPPDAYCNTSDGEILRQILPSFDQETTDFYRWKIVYQREELERLILKKSGVDVGVLLDLQPLHRGPSGRITRLRIVGTNRSVVVGKELEIRRWLSPSHLYSSAFLVRADRDADGTPARFTLLGAGWGHGVGLCQIGAAVMATRGFPADAIVRHYFRGAALQKLYR